MSEQDSTKPNLTWWQTWQTGVVLGLLLALPYLVMVELTGHVGAPVGCTDGIDVMLNILYLLMLFGTGVVMRYNYAVRPSLTRQERWTEISVMLIGMPLLGMVVLGVPPCLAALWGN